MVQSHLEPYKADRLLVKATALPDVGNIIGIIRDKQHSLMRRLNRMV